MTNGSIEATKAKEFADTLFQRMKDELNACDMFRAAITIRNLVDDGRREVEKGNLSKEDYADYFNEIGFLVTDAINNCKCIKR